MPAFCSAGHLPGNDRLVIGRCFQSTVYPFFSEEIRGKLSVAEFLGLLCRNFVDNVLNFENLIKEFKKENEVINLADEIKECLRLASKQRLFYKYKGFGRKLMIEAREKVEMMHSPVESSFKPFSYQVSPKSEYSSNDEELPKPRSPESESSIVALSDDLARQLHKKLFDDVLKELKHHEDDNEFFLLTIGLCDSPELVSFDELEDDRDKLNTLKCSVSCVKTFFQNIHNQFVEESHTLEDTKGTTINSFLPNLDSFAMDTSISPITNIQDITDEAKQWLQKYDDTYFHIVKHFNTMKINFLDAQLRRIYINYESCVRWECAMKTLQDIPISQLMKRDAYENIKYSIFRAFANAPAYESSSSDDSLINQWLPYSLEVGETSSAPPEAE